MCRGGNYGRRDALRFPALRMLLANWIIIIDKKEYNMCNSKFFITIGTIFVLIILLAAIAKWTQFFIAIGTILLAIIAIWGKSLWPPKLQVDLRNKRGELIKMDSEIENTWYYHLRVWNERRKTTLANYVQVVVTTLERSDDKGLMRPIPLSGPIRLEWQWEQSNPKFPKIGPERTCDLGHLKKGESFKLKTIFDPGQYNFTVAKDERMIVGIVAQSNEVESNELKLYISWDGTWNKDRDEMSNHLVINPL